jgi:hypothetical protein
MPCGRVSRSQFASQAEYEDHRMRMMKLILGDDWTDQLLSKLVEAHRELRRLTLEELITQHEREHEDSHELRSTTAWTAEVNQPEDEQPASKTPPTDTAQAIESGEGRLIAEDWLRS